MLRSSALLLLILSGCMANDGLGSMASSEINIYKISRLSVGMKQWEVLEMMRQPYSHQTFEIDNSIYDVWFYVTRPTVLGQSRMVPQNLTPLTFKNGELIGWGFAYYQYLVKKDDAIDTKKTENVDKKLENEELEKALQAPASSQKTPTPPAKPAPTPPVEQIKKKSPEKNSPTQKPLSKPSVGKTETLKVEPMKIEPMDKSKPNTPQQQKVDPLKPPPSSEPGHQQTPVKSKHLSMSSSPKTKPTPPKEPPAPKPPIEEEDNDMIDEASDQNFNQT